MATAVARPVPLMVAIGVAGVPGDGAGEVLMAAVGVGTGGGELLRRSLGDRRIGRRHGDRHQRGRRHGQPVEPLMDPTWP